MPDRHILHIADTFSFDRLGDEQKRAAALSCGDCLENRRGIVPVDLGHFPSESSEFVAKRIKARVGFRSAPEALEIVVVDRRDEVVEPQR